MRKRDYRGKIEKHKTMKITEKNQCGILDSKEETKKFISERTEQEKLGKSPVFQHKRDENRKRRRESRKGWRAIVASL